MTKLTTEQRLANKLKEVEIKEKESLIIEKERKSKIDSDNVSIKKIEVLREILCCHVYDESGISGMEQKLKPMMDDSEQERIKAKIFEIVHKL